LKLVKIKEEYLAKLKGEIELKRERENCIYNVGV